MLGNGSQKQGVRIFESRSLADPKVNKRGGEGTPGARADAPAAHGEIEFYFSPQNYKNYKNSRVNPPQQNMTKHSHVEFVEFDSNRVLKRQTDSNPQGVTQC